MPHQTRSNPWVFSPKARYSLVNSTARVNIWEGSVRSGKTINANIRFLEEITGPASGEDVIIARTVATAYRNLIRPIITMVGSKTAQFKRGTNVLHIGDREIFVFGANDETSAEKIRGLTVARALGDELTLWPESMAKELLNRMSAPNAKAFFTTNPGPPAHWFKRDFIDRAAELGYKSFHFTLDDNPALDPKYVAALKAEHPPGSLWHKRFIQGLWVNAEGAVFDFFNENLHTLPASHLPKTRPDELWVTADYGTSNPTAAILIGKWRKPNISVALGMYFYDGRSRGVRTDGQHADAIEKWLGTRREHVRGFVLDPSAASFKAELRSRGWFVRDAKNDVLDGIRMHAEALDGGVLKILQHPSLQPIINEYSAYAWDPKAQARGEDKPIKADDHTMDAIRYYIATIQRRVNVGARRNR